jgi:hypothetical protein
MKSQNRLMVVYLVVQQLDFFRRTRCEMVYLTAFLDPTVCPHLLCKVSPQFFWKQINEIGAKFVHSKWAFVCVSICSALMLILCSTSIEGSTSY